MLNPEQIQWICEFTTKVQDWEKARTAGTITTDEAHAKLMDLLHSCTRDQLQVLGQIVAMVSQSGLLGAVSLPADFITLIREANRPETIQ